MSCLLSIQAVIFCTNKEWSETWIRCLHVRASVFMKSGYDVCIHTQNRDTPNTDHYQDTRVYVNTLIVLMLQLFLGKEVILFCFALDMAWVRYPPHQTHFLVDKKKKAMLCFFCNDQMNVDLRAVNYASQFKARSLSSLLPFLLW